MDQHGRFADLESGDIPGKDENHIQEFKFLGYPIYVGRNAYSNENLVKNHPHRTCFWLHAHRSKGPHVVLCVDGLEAPNEIILRRAASLAVFITTGNEHPEVSVAPLADVYKPQENPIGVWKTWRRETIHL